MQSFPFDSELTYDEHDNPIYDRAVSSQPLRKLIKELFTTGVMPNPSTNLQVSAGSDGMTVQIAAGFAVIDGGLCRETETRTLEVTAADNTYDRIDTVVLRWNENVDVRNADLYVIAGTPAVNPVRPTLQRNNSIYEIGLADVFITKRVATITDDKITDTRYEAERCGVVSSISEFDTTTLYQQIQADLTGFKATEQANFLTWYENIRNILDENAAGHLQNEIDALQPVRKRTITNLLDPSKYVIKSTLTTHGVTVTNNGDGTFTVNGTTDNDVGTDGKISINLYPYRTISIVITNVSEIKFCGTPSGMTNKASLQLMDINDTDIWYNENTGLIVPTVDDNLLLGVLRLQLYPSTTFDNVVFKPMLTKDLDATYDDYVEYSGNGELNKNVADVAKQLTANGTKFQFAIDDGRYGYIKEENGVRRFYPFSGGGANIILLGTYTANVTIDVSDLDVQSASEFIAVSESMAGSETGSVAVNSPYAKGYGAVLDVKAPTLSLSSDKKTLTLTVGTGSARGYYNDWWNLTVNKTATTKVYYIGKVKFKGTVHLGRYSANATINVANLGATSTNQFLVTTASGSASAFSTAGGSNITSSSGYTPATLSLSGDTLTVTAPTVSVYHQASGGAGGPSYGRCTYDVYFVGDIGEI